MPSPPSPPADRKPLLPTHVHQTHRLSSPKISFPSSGVNSSKHQQSSSPGDQHLAQRDQAHKPGIPKLTRECFFSELWCYGKWVLLIGGINAILVGLGLWVYFGKIHHRDDHH